VWGPSKRRPGGPPRVKGGGKPRSTSGPRGGRGGYEGKVARIPTRRLAMRGGAFPCAPRAGARGARRHKRAGWGRVRQSPHVDPHVSSADRNRHGPAAEGEAEVRAGPFAVPFARRGGRRGVSPGREGGGGRGRATGADPTTGGLRPRSPRDPRGMGRATSHLPSVRDPAPGGPLVPALEGCTLSNATFRAPRSLGAGVFLPRSPRSARASRP